jgi:hypothetical protein
MSSSTSAAAAPSATKKNGAGKTARLSL